MAQVKTLGSTPFPASRRQSSIIKPAASATTSERTSWRRNDQSLSFISATVSRFLYYAVTFGNDSSDHPPPSTTVAI